MTKPSNDSSLFPSPAQPRRARLPERGAAMVEAGLVLPVLVCFLGVGTLMYRAYQTKLDQNQGIRNAALDYAAHDCERSSASAGLGPAGKGTVSREATTLGHSQRTGGNGQSQALQDAMEARSPAVSGKSGFAQADYATQTLDNPFQSKANGGKGLQIKVHGARSQTLCNEPPMDGNLKSMAKTIVGEIEKAGGGSANDTDSHTHDSFKTKD